MADLREMTGTLNELSKGFIRSQILFAANDAGVFPLLEEERDAATIAESVGWDPRATRMLLDSLVALELVTKSNGQYRNAAIASACLVPDRRGYQGHIIRHHANFKEAWDRLEDALRTGESAHGENRERSDHELRAFILGMSDIARFSSQEVLDAVDLSPYRRMLDVGGGPATYSIAFVERHPQLTATVFDLPPVIEIAREQVAATGLEDRVSYIPGDLATDDFGSGYDLVLVSNIIHSLSEDANRALVRKCYDALDPGGLLILKDFLADNDRSGPAFSLLFALHMLVNTGDGDTYTFEQVERWTNDAGFDTGRVISLTPQTRLWLVTRP